MSLAGLLATGAVAAPTAEHVRVSASTSGSTLTVGVATLPRSRCALRLGGGAEALNLPDLRVGGTGRGGVRTGLPTDAPTGEQQVVAACGHAGVERVGKTSVSISAISLHGPVATGFNIALDILLVGALIVFAWLLVEMVILSAETRERLLRSLALAGGAILALGAQVSGVEFARSMVDSLVGNDAMGAGGKVLLAIAVGLVAASFGWYFTQVAIREETRGLRLACALGAMTIFALALILAEAFDRQGLFLAAAAIPNFAFMVGLVGGVIFSVPAADASTERSGGVLTNLVGRLGKGRGRGDDGAPTAERRNPFAGD